jgi:hypothetical protein
MRQLNELDQEEHRLLSLGEAKMGLDEHERSRLHELDIEIDRLWDLVRQQRARRHAGLDPEGAKLRSGRVVERYQQ